MFKPWGTLQHTSSLMCEPFVRFFCSFLQEAGRKEEQTRECRWMGRECRIRVRKAALKCGKKLWVEETGENWRILGKNRLGLHRLTAALSFQNHIFPRAYKKRECKSAYIAYTEIWLDVGQLRDPCSSYLWPFHKLPFIVLLTHSSASLDMFSAQPYVLHAQLLQHGLTLVNRTEC